MVEPDGEWHTLDNKFASVGWRASHPLVPAAPVATRATPVKIEPKVESLGAEIFVLDSDEEDEGRVKRELSPRYASSSFSVQSSYATLPPPSQVEQAVNGVIDLTADSDDETPPTPYHPSAPSPLAIPPAATKRKAPEEHSPSEAIWKKSRASAGQVNGGGTSSTSGTASPRGYPAQTSYPMSHASSQAARRSPSVDDRYGHDRYSRYKSPQGSGTGYWNGSSSTSYRYSDSRWG